MFDIRKGNSAIRDITKGWTALFLNNEANKSSNGRMNVTDRVEKVKVKTSASELYLDICLAMGEKCIQDSVYKTVVASAA